MAKVMEMTKTAAPVADRFKIEDGVPFPTRARGIAFPLDKLEAGKSFLVPAEDAKALRPAIARFVKGKTDLKGKFVTEKQDDGAIRVWRK